MSFAVREAEIGDLDKLVYFTMVGALEGEGLQIPPDVIRQGVSKAIENPDLLRYWVLESSRFGVVGCVSVREEWNAWNAGMYWWIQTIFLLPEYRGQNLMDELVEHVRDQARRANVIEIRLYVHKDNKRAMKAYNREGFADSPYEIMIKKL